MPQEIMRTRSAQGHLIITDTAIIIELAVPGAGHRDVLMRQFLTGVDVKTVFITAATITFYGQGQRGEAYPGTPLGPSVKFRIISHKTAGLHIMSISSVTGTSSTICMK